MAKTKRIDKAIGLRLKKARMEQKLTYDELAEKSGVSTRYIKEIENRGNIPSLEIFTKLIRALNISADPFFFPNMLVENLDYKRLQLYLTQCTEDQITTILAIVEAYLRTYQKPIQESSKISEFSFEFFFTFLNWKRWHVITHTTFSITSIF